ncbi:MAG: YaiO family outer membrane beta-barrel protein [Daejeonella sp.]|uniref:YaiO family outer membrane beta-barrel protein n=1 Tax=Daejeonella sp. TaxID=2805397 RepID=UPI0027376E16|nr:YaiO family outer membrane beta-barrel protein [Daejeonella sp.]MDP3469431.1 YaiO family outer membrane beta-barrel protein [Daejeonella sp.]
MSLTEINYSLVLRGILCLIVLFSLSTIKISAQETESSDELFIKARKLAFDDKNYIKAIALTKQALIQSPDYADIRIFLGRLYTWTDKPDSARIEFKKVLEKNQGYEDLYLAYGSMEYWNKNPEEAFKIVSEGIRYNEKSESLLLLGAKIFLDLKKFEEANLTLRHLLKLYPNSTQARALAGTLGNIGSKNRIGFSYDYVYFDKQFDDPWHLGSIDYSRQTGIGPLTARVNFANRFKTNGTQLELDFYPRISNTFYAYMSGGYSGNVGVFPEYRAGFSLYANLPSAFEAEAGFRMLSFNDQTWIYTASLGKYHENFWFNLRTFLSPSSNDISQSVAFSTRYYFGGANDFLSLVVGTGLSPDNPRNNLLYNNGNTYKLKSNNISLGYRKSIKTTNILIFKASLENQQYLPDTRGNQLELGIGYMKLF